MTTRYVPEQYPDFETALLACASGDEIVLDTNAAMLLQSVVSALDNITVRAGTDKTPVLDHTLAGTAGLTVTGDGWTLEGLRFRSTVAGSGGYALFLDGGSSMAVSQCIFEGQPSALTGAFTGTVSRCQFRNQTGTAIDIAAAVNIDSCEFLRCVGTRVILGTSANVRDCTFIQCRSTQTNVRASTIRNCTAQACVRGAGYTFDAVSNGSYLNAYLCTGGSGNFNGAGTDRTTVDPQHVNLTTDLRLLPTSPLIRTGGAPAVAFDYNGAQFQTPPSIGAHESIVIDNVSVTDTSTIECELVGDYLDDVASPEGWTIATTTGVRVAVLAVEYDAPDVTITTWPEMSPGCAYTLTASFGGYGAAVESLTPASNLALPALSPVYRNVAAQMNSIAWQLYNLAGVAETVIAFDFGPSDTVCFVGSTYGFAEAGAFWCEQVRYTYTSKTDAAFHGVASVLPRYLAQGEGSVVVFDPTSQVLPP